MSHEERKQIIDYKVSLYVVQQTVIYFSSVVPLKL